jgi:hypothetical protein
MTSATSDEAALAEKQSIMICPCTTLFCGAGDGLHF